MLRNKEIRQLFLALLITAVAGTAAGFGIGRSTGWLVLILTGLFMVFILWFIQGRYKKISRLSEEIDAVLHNTEYVLLADSEEGELSILRSEIAKMTQRIWEQNAALKKEKNHLADALADIAHQFRTPLTSANLILSLLETRPSEDEQKELLRETKELYVQIEWLITALLKLSRLDAGVVEFRSSRTEVKELIQRAAAPFLLSMELHSIALQMHIPENVWIQVDPGWVSEAIQNILKNCIESVANNGKIEIACEDNSIFTQITIHDSGAGIPAEDLPFLFERFYRGKNSDTAGYGIGLALCKTILMRQNGTVSARNHPEGGAVFVIRFFK